jgi:hypothetical protein
VAEPAPGTHVPTPVSSLHWRRSLSCIRPPISLHLSPPGLCCLWRLRAGGCSPTAIMRLLCVPRKVRVLSREGKRTLSPLLPKELPSRTPLSVGGKSQKRCSFAQLVWELPSLPPTHTYLVPGWGLPARSPHPFLREAVGRGGSSTPASKETVLSWPRILWPPFRTENLIEEVGPRTQRLLGREGSPL